MEQHAPKDHNLPDPIEALRLELAQDHAALVSRKQALLDGAAKTPEAIADDETAAKVSDFVKQISGAMKQSESARTEAKRPYDDMGSAVQGFFKGISTPLEDAKKGLLKKLTAFQEKKADEERKQRERDAAEARRIAEEVARQAQEAITNVESEDDLEAAIEAEQAARKAADDLAKANKAATGSDADMTKARGDYGSVASIRVTWKYELVDLSLVPRSWLTLDEKKVGSAIKGQDGVRNIPGLRIYPDKQTVVR